MKTFVCILSFVLLLSLPDRSESAIDSTVRVLSVHPARARLGDEVTIRVSNPDRLNQDTTHGALYLFVDGVPLKGLATDPVLLFDGSAKFILERKDIDSNLWKSFYHYPRASVAQNLSITVGHLNGIIATPLRNWQFTVVDETSFLVGIIADVVLALLLMWLAKKHRLLQDSVSGVYSLSRSQFAFWTLVVLASFLYIWVVTGVRPVLGPNTLLLLAIATGTSASVAMQDSRPNLASGTPISYTGSRWKFFLDILSDETGLSVHRFQMVIWTIALGFVYVCGAVVDLTLPELSATLLGLMGISAAGYVGLRSLEGNTSGSPPIVPANSPAAGGAQVLPAKPIPVT